MNTIRQFPEIDAAAPPVSVTGAAAVDVALWLGCGLLLVLVGTICAICAASLLDYRADPDPPRYRRGEIIPPDGGGTA